MGRPIVDLVRTGKEFSRRIKLSDENKEEIKKLHKQGIAIRALSRDFNVSKRLIQFILFPERQEINIQLRKERGGSKIYYDVEKNRLSQADHRAYKKDLLSRGLLKLEVK